MSEVQAATPSRIVQVSGLVAHQYLDLVLKVIKKMRQRKNLNVVKKNKYSPATKKRIKYNKLHLRAAIIQLTI